MSDNILKTIVATKWVEIASDRQRLPLEELEARLNDAPPPRDFVAALRAAPDVGLIAEIKKASPSVGLIRADFDPVTIAQAYEASGASCLSILTDESYFQGKLEYIPQVRAASALPILRKDFIVDRYQVAAARCAGADAILLIAECLDDCTMRDLYFYAADLGMECLIELYDASNLERILKLDPKLVGVNNRDLRNFLVDLGHSLRLRHQVPQDIVFVSESGIANRKDVETLKQAGVDAILVGESLMRSPDIGQAVRALVRNR